MTGLGWQPDLLVGAQAPAASQEGRAEAAATSTWAVGQPHPEHSPPQAPEPVLGTCPSCGGVTDRESCPVPTHPQEKENPKSLSHWGAFLPWPQDTQGSTGWQLRRGQGALREREGLGTSPLWHGPALRTYSCSETRLSQGRKLAKLLPTGAPEGTGPLVPPSGSQKLCMYLTGRPRPSSSGSWPPGCRR